MDAEFPSKRDAWLVAVIWLSVVMLLGGAFVILRAPGPFAARVGMTVFLLAAALFEFHVLYSTGYSIGAGEVAVRSGPFRWRVPLAGIESVVPTRSPLSSPACSLDRLRVEWRDARGARRVILLSPDDKSGFLAALAARCPALALAGDRLAPRG